MQLELKETKFPGYYITKDCRVFSTNQKHKGLCELKVGTFRNGYKYFKLYLSDEKKCFSYTIHRCMWETFNGVIEDDSLVINHIDGDKTNNDLSNLELVTHAENLDHAVKIGLRMSPSESNKMRKTKNKELITDDILVEMILKVANGQSKASVSREYGVNETYMKSICCKQIRSDIWDDERLNHITQLVKPKNNKQHSDEKILELLRRILINKDDKSVCSEYNIPRNYLNEILRGCKRKNLLDQVKYECNDYSERK